MVSKLSLSKGELVENISSKPCQQIFVCGAEQHFHVPSYLNFLQYPV